MSAPNKPVNIRLTPELAERFNKLASTMPTMARSHLLRLLIESALQGSLEEQIERVTKQLVKPEAVSRSHHHHRVNSRV